MRDSDAPIAAPRIRSGVEWAPAFGMVREPIFVHDGEARIVYANPAYIEQAGIPLASLIHKPYWQIFPRTEGVLPCCHRRKAGGADIGGNEIVESRGRFFLSRCYSFSLDDDRFGIHVLFDVTAPCQEKVQLQRMYEAFKNYGHEGFFTLDAARAITDVNSAFEGLFAYAERDLLGQPFTRLLARDHPANRAAFPAGDANWAGEVVCRHKDGSEIPCHVNFAVVRGNGGALLGYVGSLLDLRPTKATQRALAHQAQTLQERVKELRCLCVVSELATRDDLSVAMLMTRTAEQLPSAFGEPSACAARIRFEGNEYTTAGFREMPWMQSSEIRVDGNFAGTVEIAYLEQRPEADEGPFLREERVLIDTIADRLGAAVRERRARAEVARSEERLRGLIRLDPHAAVVVDAAGTIRFANPASEVLLGGRANLVGAPFGLPVVEKGFVEVDVVQPGNSRPVVAEMRAVTLEWDGEPCWLVTLYDITERKRYEEQLTYQANFDQLTGLPNRSLMQDRLAQALAFGRRDMRLVVVMFLDIDRFKMVNDTLDHFNGDELLKVVAARLKATLHESDTVARYGGDAFVIILHDLLRAEDANPVAKRLRAAVAEPIAIAGRELQMTASLGASVFPRDGTDAATLLRNADSAMHAAKESGRDTFQFFTAELNTRLVRRMDLETALRRALEQDELTLHYQPQLDLRSGAVVGVEALLRWQHPEYGPVAPSQFIPLAEESGLIVPIGEWVLRSACHQAIAWQRAGLRPLSVAVNVSACQAQQGAFDGIVMAILAESGLDPHYLELELTESAIMKRPGEWARMLNRIKALGVRLALDDFGTGYSCLSYLHQFPFDKVKIDQSFIRDITANPHNASIALSVISLAQSLGLTVIAEGVESEAQLRYLQLRGCDQMQGFYFSRPIDAGETEALLRVGKGLSVGREEEGPILLVASDDAEIIDALCCNLRNESYRILTATHPEQVFELLALHRVQVLLSDQRVSPMAGTELMGRAKRLYPHTIRMSLSSPTEMKALIDALNQGCVYRFLIKPWDGEALKKEIRSAFREYESNRKIWSSPRRLPYKNDTENL